MAISTLLLVLVAFLASRSGIEGVTIDIPPRGKVCVYQYYAESEEGKAEVFVVNGGNLDIQFTVEGPFQDANGVPTRVTPATKIVFDEVVSSSSSYINRDDHPAGVSATADGVELTWMAEPGAYSVCLDNSMSQMQTKVVDFTLPSPKSALEAEEEDLEEEWEESSAGNGTIPENIRQSYKADLALLRKSSERIGRTLKDIQTKQYKERHRLALQTAANENNHSKMVVSSLFETVVFIGVSIFQLFYVRRWFEGRGLKTRQWA